MRRRVPGGNVVVASCFLFLRRVPCKVITTTITTIAAAAARGVSQLRLASPLLPMHPMASPGAAGLPPRPRWIEETYGGGSGGSGEGVLEDDEDDDELPPPLPGQEKDKGVAMASNVALPV